MLNWRQSLAILAIATLPIPAGADEAGAESEPPDYPLLLTKGGEIYERCHVMDSDEEALVIRHQGGVARISFFDLDASIQEKFGFDPVAGLKAYKENLDRERERRKIMVLEGERVRAEQHRLEKLHQQYAVARVEWTPAEASVVRTDARGAFVRARGIVFVPTTKKSTLGFTVPGTPKRKLVNFADGLIYLELLEDIPKPGSKWVGYINPVVSEMKVDPVNSSRTVPVHEAIAKRP